MTKCDDVTGSIMNKGTTGTNLEKGSLRLLAYWYEQWNRGKERLIETDQLSSPAMRTKPGI